MPVEAAAAEEPSAEEWTVDAHNYVTLGSGTGGWVAAGWKKATGLNWFGTGRELFWITPQQCARHLQQLKALCDDCGVQPTVDAMVPLTSDGVARAFAAMHSRRTKGKYVIQVGPEEAAAASRRADGAEKAKGAAEKN
jgi:NADPH:quinone reductase-like Zn-dependent oxidoreductase